MLSERRLPESGWSEITIEYVLQQIALMDSNNFPSNVGLGEREGRVISSIVQKRHFRLSHGIGRSGDLVGDEACICLYVCMLGDIDSRKTNLLY